MLLPPISQTSQRGTRRRRTSVGTEAPVQRTATGGERAGNAMTVAGCSGGFCPGATSAVGLLTEPRRDSIAHSGNSTFPVTTNGHPLLVPLTPGPLNLPAASAASSQLLHIAGPGSSPARVDKPDRTAGPRARNGANASMNGRTIAQVLLVILLIGGAIGLGVTAYDAGVANGLAQNGNVVVAPGGYPVGPYAGWGY